MSHGMYEWVMNESWHVRMSHVNESCHISRINEIQNRCAQRCTLVTCKWVMPRINESRYTDQWVMTHMWMSHVTNQWVMSHTWTSHVTYQWVMSHINESCHISMSHVTNMNESCHISMSHVTYQWVMSHTKSPDSRCHIFMSHVTLIDESFHTHEWVMSHIWMSHVTYAHLCVHLFWIWRHICDVTRSCVCVRVCFWKVWQRLQA